MFPTSTSSDNTRAETLKNEGNRRLSGGDSVGAENCYRAAIAIDPGYAHAHANLGVALLQQQRDEEAGHVFTKALALDPSLAVAHYHLAILRYKANNLDDAQAIAMAGIVQAPGMAELHNCLGKILLEKQQRDAALQSFRRALEIRPDYAEAHYNLGYALQEQEQYGAATTCYERALAINPDFAEAHNNLGVALVAQGRLEETIAINRRALACKPDYDVAHSNLIFALDLAAGETVATQQAERRRWDVAHAAHLLSSEPHPNAPDPDRRLRIGYVSADFRIHSGACVFGAMLMQFDREQFDVYAYSNSSSNYEDETSRQLKQHVTAWRNIFGVADATVADMIRADGIDILVDLSGHSAGNRLLVFARKPAPIQITAWGFATSTGIRAMDAFFADPVIVPPEEKHLYVEEIRYLPNVVSYYQPRPLPPVNALPALTTGQITFGSFNRIAKISAQAFAVWGQVLNAVPDSRMVLKASELSDASARKNIIDNFVRVGVAPERITLLGKTFWSDHLAAFNQVDIALDPFPHGGGVSAIEGLAMGVPYIALRWPSPVGRTSVSILTTLGLTDWIAESPEQYVDLALQKTKNLLVLAALRTQLRARFLASPIGDTKTYVHAVETEYRNLWQQRCKCPPH